MNQSIWSELFSQTSASLFGTLVLFITEEYTNTYFSQKSGSMRKHSSPHILLRAQKLSCLKNKRSPCWLLHCSSFAIAWLSLYNHHYISSEIVLGCLACETFGGLVWCIAVTHLQRSEEGGGSFLPHVIKENSSCLLHAVKTQSKVIK